MGGGSADCLETSQDSISHSTDSTSLPHSVSKSKKMLKVSAGHSEECDELVDDIGSQSSDSDCNGALSNGLNKAHDIVHCNGTSSIRVSDVPWNNDDYVRVLMQALDDLGYKQTVSQLESESGLQLRQEPALRLQSAVLDGDWTRADALLDTLALEPEVLLKWRLAMRRQHYLELLDSQRVDDALAYLRSDLAPLSAAPQDLACLLLAPSPVVLRRTANWPGPTTIGRQALWEDMRALLPPRLVTPSRRLDTLFRQALRYQEQRCPHYNHAEPWGDLLTDCHASADDSLPQRTLHILEDHTDEVWFVQFSHDGRRLASASKDRTIIIWEVSLESASARLVLRGNANSGAFLSWSPDDSMLLSCGSDHTVRVWDTSTGEIVQELRKHTDSVTAALWLSDGKHVMSGGVDKQLILWRIGQPEPIAQWVGERIHDLAVGEGVLVTSAPDHKLRVYSMPDRTQLAMLSEVECCTSVCLSADSTHMLVNISSETRPEVHLWDIREQRVVQRYQGHGQFRYIIRSSFGGLRESYVVCGSEDSVVYVWNRHSGALLCRLAGHASTVNSVAWNPVETRLMASASDDNTIRVWAPLRLPTREAAAAPREAAQPSSTAAGGCHGAGSFSACA